MAAVTAMHEQMHHTATQQQKDQKPVSGKNMNAMLEPQEQGCDCQRDDQADPEA
jgi:hypothetical protein